MQQDNDSKGISYNNSNNNCICNDELSDLIACFGNISNNPLFNDLKPNQKTSTAFVLRQSLALAIYFIQRNDLERARDAFVNSSELVRLLPVEKLYNLSNQGIQYQRDITQLFEKIIVIIECIDRNTHSLQHSNQSIANRGRADASKRQSSSWDIVARRHAEQLQQRSSLAPTTSSTNRFSDHTSYSTPGLQKQENGSNNNGVHKLKQLFFNTFSLVKSGATNSSVSAPITNVDNIKSESYHPKIPQQKDTVQLLQQRLASIMSDNDNNNTDIIIKRKSLLPATGSITEPETSIVFTTTRSTTNSLQLIDLRQELSHIQGLSNNVLNILMDLYKKYSLNSHENIINQLQQYAENLTQEQSNTELENIFKRLDFQIYSHICRIVYEVECINQNRVILNKNKQLLPFLSSSYNSIIDGILCKYAEALGIVDSTRLLLYVKVLAEKFEHTCFHLSRSLQTLKQLKQLIQNTNELTRDVINGIDSLTNLFIRQCRMRIVELNFCFGALTFSTSTNDYSEDHGVDSLDLLIQCLIIILEIRQALNLINNNDKSGAKFSISEILHTWLQSAIHKIFIINSEEIRSRLQDRNELKGLFFEATKLFYLCEFITTECKALFTRFGNVFDKYLGSTDNGSDRLDFMDIICIEFSLHITQDIDQFCIVTDRHQMNKIKTRIKTNNIEFELSLSLFHRLCSSIEQTFKYLTSSSPKVKPYPISDRFYALIQRYLFFQFSSKLRTFVSGIIENDVALQPFNSSVLYTNSCVEVMNSCFEALQIVAELDSIIRKQSKKYKSLLVEYFEVIHRIVVIFLEHTSQRFRDCLEGKITNEVINNIIRNMNDRIRIACLCFNNVNGLFLLYRKKLIHFNNTTFIEMNWLIDRCYVSISDDYNTVEQSEFNGEEDEEDEELTIAAATLDDDAPVDIFDLGCVKSLMTDLRMTSNSIALYFAQFIFQSNEKKFMDIFKRFDKNVLEDLLTSLDKFFMVTSEFLYIEQLYEVLKHLFVIFVQKLIDILLNPISPVIQKPILPFSFSLSGMSTSAAPLGDSLEEATRKLVGNVLESLKELFYANGDGLKDQFLLQHSRPLSILISIYHDSTDILIELYQKLTDVQPFLAAFSDANAANNASDNSDNMSVASSDTMSSASSSSCSSMAMIQSIHQQLSNQQLTPNELIKPEYILLLLGSRKRDREARHFVKKVLRKRRKKHSK